MSAKLRSLCLAALAGLSACTVAACQIGSPVTAGQTFCDGIDAAVGGCDPDRPMFTAASCTDIGVEFGRQLNDRLLKIYDGPDVVNNETKAVRAGDVLSLSMSLANLYVRRIGLIATCGADEFVDAAETQFSAELKSKAGSYLADGPPATYEEWLQIVRDFATLLDLEEAAPVAS